MDSQTNTVTAVIEANTEKLKSKYNISAPLFLAFAEYPGYVSTSIKWIDDWVCGSEPSPEVAKFIEIEASVALNELQKEYDSKTMRALYDDLYDVILGLYDSNLKMLEKKRHG
jgi:hypothetical protein